MTTTWNPSDAGSGKFTFSNGNLTATSVGSTNAWNSARGNSYLSSGKVYFEFTGNTIQTANFGIMIGLMNATGSLANYAGASTNGVSWQAGGSLYQNGAQLINGTGSNGYTQGNVTAIAVDLTNNLIWVWNQQGSNWNNSGTANPGTGVGGISITSLGTCYPAISVNPANGTNAGTLNTSGPFNYTVPTGFSAWDATAVGYANVSGVVREALVQSTAVIRTGQTIREALLSGQSQARLGAVVREALVSDIVPIRSAGIVREVLLSTTFRVLTWNGLKISR